MRIATFNIENLDDGVGDAAAEASFAERVKVLRPMLERLRADVICFQEVHGQDPLPGQTGPRGLRALKTLLSQTRYAGFELSSTTLKGKPDVEAERNLVVASSPDFVVEEVREVQGTLALNPPQYAYVTPTSPQSVRKIGWERPTLYVRLRRGSEDPLHLLNVHFKSKIPTTIPDQKASKYVWKSAAGWAEGYFVSSMKRVGAALETRIFIDELFDNEPEAQIAVCGDFNAEPHEVPVMAIRGRTEDTGNSDLNSRVMQAVALSIAEDRRWTLIHEGEGGLLDHMLVSRRMMGAFLGAEIHNEMVHDESVRGADDRRFPESDHAPVVAAFDPETLTRSGTN